MKIKRKPSENCWTCISFCSDEIFTRIDVDNDGELNVQEFMKGCQEDQVFTLFFKTKSISKLFSQKKSVKHFLILLDDTR